MWVVGGTDEDEDEDGDPKVSLWPANLGGRAIATSCELSLGYCQDVERIEKME